MKKVLIHINLLGSLFVTGQSPMMDLEESELRPLAINYTFIQDIGGNEVKNYGLNLSLGIPLKRGVVGFSLGYQDFDFTFNTSTNLIDLSSFEDMYFISSSISYLRPLENNLSFIVSGGTSIISNLANELSSQDFVFNAILGMMKKWGDENRRSTLLIGAFYGTQLGEPTLLPALSFSQKLNEYWSYTLGLPVTGINFRFNKKHKVSFLVSPQGIFGNNSNELPVDGNRVISNSKLQFNALNTRICYQFRVMKNLAFFTEGGFLPTATLKILDNNNNEILDLEPNNAPYFNVGLRLIFQKPDLNGKH